MQSSARRLSKWLLICIAAAVVAVIAWITIEGLRPIHIRSEAARSAAIGYGTLREDTKRPQIVINEIWKHPGSGGKLAVGDAIAVPTAAASARPDGFIVFFERPWFSSGARLRVSAIVAVYHGRVSLEDLSLSEAKALCVATPSI
jgi:hypothetical protein